MRHLEATSASTAILSYTEQRSGVRLIALATHGRGIGGRLLFGSDAANVFASAPISLLFLHPPKDEHLPSGPMTNSSSYQTIVVPLDGTSPSKQVLEKATALSLTCKASVLLFLPHLPATSTGTTGSARIHCISPSTAPLTPPQSIKMQWHLLLSLITDS